jgi:hypothetical protein
MVLIIELESLLRVRVLEGSLRSYSHRRSHLVRGGCRKSVLLELGIRCHLLHIKILAHNSHRSKGNVVTFRSTILP